MTHSLSRRGLALGLAALPLAGATAGASAPSNLAQACDWAAAHRRWLCEAACGPEFDDKRIGAEMARHEAVVVRAIHEASRSSADVAAKARLILEDVTDGGMADSEYNDDKLLIVVLREVIALCA